MTTPLNNIGPNEGHRPAKRSGLNASDANKSTNKAGKSVPSPASPLKSESANPTPPIEDRVEISQEGKLKAQGEEANKSRDLAFARKAMLGIPPLTEDHVRELQTRIKERYYSKPEVIDKVADKLTDDLTPLNKSENQQTDASAQDV